MSDCFIESDAFCCIATRDHSSLGLGEDFLLEFFIAMAT